MRCLLSASRFKFISFDNGDAHALAIGRPTSMCITAKKKLWVDLGEILRGFTAFRKRTKPTDFEHPAYGK